MIKSKVKELMSAKNITYEQLEKKTGLSSRTITRARSHLISECRLSTLRLIAKELGVQISDLYEDLPDAGHK